MLLGTGKQPCVSPPVKAEQPRAWAARAAVTLCSSQFGLRLLGFHIRHCKNKVLAEPSNVSPFLGEPRSQRRLRCQGVVAKGGFSLPKRAGKLRHPKKQPAALGFDPVPAQGHPWHKTSLRRPLTERAGGSGEGKPRQEARATLPPSPQHAAPPPPLAMHGGSPPALSSPCTEFLTELRAP